MSTAYDARLQRELEIFTSPPDFFALPASHYFWSENFLLPLLAEVGFGSFEAFWDDQIAAVSQARGEEKVRIVSLGSGDGALELAIAKRLGDQGITNLEWMLTEVNPAPLEVALASARELGVHDQVSTSIADLNNWTPPDVVDVYIANHCLHHIVELEQLFDGVARSLAPDGLFLVNDMVGRNGHRRWPEALAIIELLWARLPERYKTNRIYQQVDTVYRDLDCSTEGFEGVRAQDIAPLLLERFEPQVFVGFANLVDPFIDRQYGPSLDPDNADDAAFLDALGRLDDAAIDLGLVTPTHLLASFGSSAATCRFPRGRSPERMGQRHVVEPSVGDEAARVEGIADQLARQVDETTRRYDALRARKAVRAALWLAEQRHRFRRP